MTAPHVVTALDPPTPLLGGAADVELVPLGRDNLGWLLACRATGDAALVDGPALAPYLPRLEARGLRLRALLITHTHGDHTGVAADLVALRRRASEVGGPPPFAEARIYGPRSRAAEVPGLSDPVDEGDSVQVGALHLQVWRTEGHLRGHVSYVLGPSAPPLAAGPGALFCGDTMFGAGCGYLFDGPAAAMAASLARIAALPPSTWLCCAHEYTWDNLQFALSVDRSDPALLARVERSAALRRQGRSTLPSTIADERATNPFLRALAVARSGWRSGDESVAMAIDSAPSEPLDPADVGAFASLRSLKDQRAYLRDAAPDPAPAGMRSR